MRMTGVLAAVALTKTMIEFTRSVLSVEIELKTDLQGSKIVYIVKSCT